MGKSSVILLTLVLTVVIFSLSITQEAEAISVTISDQSSCESIPDAVWTETDTCTITGHQSISAFEFWDIAPDIVLVIDSNSSLTIEGGGELNNSSTIENHGDLNNFDGELNNSSTIENHGDLNNFGLIRNFSIGIINNNSGGTITNSLIVVEHPFNSSIGEIKNHGIINNNDGGIINNNSGGTIDNHDPIGDIPRTQGIINNNSGGTINNGQLGDVLSGFSRINNDDGNIFNNPDGVINNYKFSAINNDGNSLFENNGGTIYNYAEFEFPEPDFFENISGINNLGHLDNKGEGTIHNYGYMGEGGTLFNEGNIINSGTIEQGLFGGSGLIVNLNILTNNSGGTIQRLNILNSGSSTIDNGGTINIFKFDKFENNSGGTIDNSGDINDHCGTFIGTIPTSGNPIVDLCPPDKPSIFDAGIGELKFKLNEDQIMEGTAEANSNVEVFVKLGDDSLQSQGTTNADASGDWSFQLFLDDGVYDIVVKSIDSDGNVSESTFVAITIDTVPPDTAIDSATDGDNDAISDNGLSDSDSMTFTFSGTDVTSGVASFECDDGSGFAACTSTHTLNSLTEGAHTFEVRAIDNVGNVDDTPASFSWTVDTFPPETLIISATDGNANPVTVIDDTTPSTSISFAFSGTDDTSGVASFECSLDAASFAACTSMQSYSSLSVGVHTFEVRAIDNAGNADSSPASFGWIVQSPQQATQELIDDIEDESLSKNVENSLLGPLKKVTKILDDGNPDNDTAACDKIDEFTANVESKRDSGKINGLSDNLISDAEAIKAALGCL